jgi:cephalosporin hydroxylase
MSNNLEFDKQVEQNIRALGSDQPLRDAAWKWAVDASIRHNYTYNFTWMDRPIIQFPQDMVGMQEIIWRTKPDLIIETGIAHGGSLVMNASLLAMLEYADAVEQGGIVDPKKPRRKVLGIDIDIRAHNRAAIEGHPMAGRIEMIQGSSTGADVIAEVKKRAKGYKNILVSLDSNHTHEHVLAELEAYAPLTTVGNYCVVFDTAIEDAPKTMFADRPWGPGNNPKTAVWEYLKSHPEFEIDKSIQHKLLITVAPDGYLRKIA